MTQPDAPAGSPDQPHPQGIDWIEKMRVLLQVLAFALAVAAVQVVFQPERSYLPPMIYSLAISSICWAVIDLGRHAFPSARETGWPQGLSSVALVTVAIAAGYLIGSPIADRICHALGWYPQKSTFDASTELRNSLLITCLAGLAASVYFFLDHKSQYLQRQMTAARRLADEARLRLLESQLEPHMLFNTLANLRMLIATDPERAIAMLDRINAYLRATLGASRTSRQVLQSEFDRTRDYLEIMSVRMGARLQYGLDLPASLAGADVPAFLLQPLVENSIRHGLEPSPDGGRIDIRAWSDENTLHLCVADTGVGLSGPGVHSTASAPGDSGFGLSQVRARLLAEYGARATLTLTSLAPHGVQAHITLPLTR